jgi:hypothetical protein
MNPTPAPFYHQPLQASTEPATFLFAPEIETALIAIAWRQPARLALVKRELDPAIHFFQPHLRWLLEAIDLAHRELGTADFASVIQVLRELGRLEDAGGLPGVNAVYEAGEFLASLIWRPEQTETLFALYLELLKTYAINRAADPPRPVYQFTGGKGTLEINKRRQKESDPDYLGEARVCGRSYLVRAWLTNDDSFLNFQLEPKI